MISPKPITINKTPHTHILAGNPVLYDISTDNFIEAAGNGGGVVLEVAGVDTVAGHYFTLSFNNIDLVFTLAVTPDDSGLQLPVGLPADTYSTWCEKLFYALRLNYDLKTHYHITLNAAAGGSRSITFLSKLNGDEWTMSLDNEDVAFISSGGSTPGVDKVYRKHFVIVGTIWNFVDGSYIKLFEDEKPVDSIGNVIFDFSEYLSVKLLPDPQIGSIKEYRVEFPEITDKHINIRSDYVQQYIASFAEKFAGEVKKLHFDDPRIAIPGGLNTEMLLVFNAYDISYFEYPQTYLRFLTWKPLTRKTTQDMTEKLFYFLHDGRVPHTYALKCKIYFEAGDPETVTFDTGSSNDSLVLECKVGYTQLDLGSHVTLYDIVAWEIWLENNLEEVISDVHRYELETRSYEYERRFLFRNSFHTYDTLRLVGKKDTNILHDRSSGHTYTGRRLSFDSWPTRNFKNIEKQNFKDNTGWITAVWKDYMREFLLSTEAYEILGDRLVPIIIKNSKLIPFLRNGETLYDLEVEYDRAFDDEFYSSIHELEYILENGFWDDQGIWKDDRQWID